MDSVTDVTVARATTVDDTEVADTGTADTAVAAESKQAAAAAELNSESVAEYRS